jgi:hypothetical protein
MMYFCLTTFSIRPGVERRSNMSQNNVAKMTFQCSFIHSTDYRIEMLNTITLAFQEKCGKWLCTKRYILRNIQTVHILGNGNRNMKSCFCNLSNEWMVILVHTACLIWYQHTTHVICIYRFSRINTLYYCHLVETSVLFISCDCML